MKRERFSCFNFKISFLVKCIKSLESEVATKYGIKGVHLFWIYSLLEHPEGLTASEIAKKNGVNRSLVSREIQNLNGKGLVCFDHAESATNRYNVRILLTERGKEVAKEFQTLGMRVQARTDRGIPEEEITIFYSVLERMSENMAKLVNEKSL